MAIEDMDRKMADRVFRVRAKKLKEQVLALSLAERFRAVADFIDQEQKPIALAIAKQAIFELEHGK